MTSCVGDGVVMKNKDIHSSDTNAYIYQTVLYTKTHAFNYNNAVHYTQHPLEEQL